MDPHQSSYNPGYPTAVIPGIGYYIETSLSAGLQSQPAHYPLE